MRECFTRLVSEQWNYRTECIPEYTIERPRVSLQWHALRRKLSKALQNFVDRIIKAYVHICRSNCCFITLAAVRIADVQSIY